MPGNFLRWRGNFFAVAMESAARGAGWGSEAGGRACRTWNLRTTPRWGWRRGGVAAWWSGGVVAWWRGGVVEWWSGGVVEWWRDEGVLALEKVRRPWRGDGRECGSGA